MIIYSFPFHTKYVPLENCPRISSSLVATFLKFILLVSPLKYATKIVYNLLTQNVLYFFLKCSSYYMFINVNYRQVFKTAKANSCPNSACNQIK